MDKHLELGKAYFYIYQGEIRFGKLLKIVGRYDGLAGMFHYEGCAKECAIPFEFIFETLKEAKEGMET